MSIRHMNSVWTDSRQDTSTKLLALLKIADIANDHGVAWPGMGTIADGIRQTDRNASRIVAEIEKTGELFVQRRPGKGNRYLICLNRKPGEISGALAAWFGIDEREAVRIEATIIEKQNSTPDNLSVPTPVSGTPDIAMSSDPSLTLSNNGHGSIREKEDYKELLDAVVMVCKKLDRMALLEPDLVNVDKLYAMEIGPEDLRHAYGNRETSWWYRVYWKGRKAQYPTTKDLVETIGQALAAIIEPATDNTEAVVAWYEVIQWINGKLAFADISDERTKAAIRKIGESNLKGINEAAIPGVRSRFIAIF